MMTMERTKLTAVVLLVALSCFSSAAMAALCDSCKCSSDGGMVFVVCQCGGNSQSLDITPQLIQQEAKKKNVINVTVSGCRQVTLRRNSLSELFELQGLKVVDASSLRIEAGSVDRVDSVVLEDVDSLELESKALLGTTIRLMHLDRVGVRKLERLAVADVKGLQSLMLMNVNVTRVEKDAVRLAMGKKSEFIVQNSHFGAVESGGVLVTSVDTFSVVRTSFLTLKENGFNVTAGEAVVVDQSKFGADLTSHGLCLTAADVNITRNTFLTLPDGMLRKNTRHLKPGQRLLFSDNTVKQRLLDVPDIAVAKEDDADGGTVQYVGNSFECECDRHLKENLQKLIDNGFAPMLEKNFCSNRKCPKYVSHAMLLQHLQKNNSAATCTEEQLCSLQSVAMTRPTHVEPHINLKSNGTGDHEVHSSSVPLLPLLATLVTSQIVAIYVM